jgi:hypothetical protein
LLVGVFFTSGFGAKRHAGCTGATPATRGTGPPNISSARAAVAASENTTFTDTPLSHSTRFAITGWKNA